MLQATSADLWDICVIEQVYCLEDVVFLQTVIVAGLQELSNVFHLHGGEV